MHYFWRIQHAPIIWATSIVLDKGVFYYYNNILCCYFFGVETKRIESYGKHGKWFRMKCDEDKEWVKETRQSQCKAKIDFWELFWDNWRWWKEIFGSFVLYFLGGKRRKEKLCILTLFFLILAHLWKMNAFFFLCVCSYCIHICVLEIYVFLLLF